MSANSQLMQLLRGNFTVKTHISSTSTHCIEHFRPNVVNYFVSCPNKFKTFFFSTSFAGCFFIPASLFLIIQYLINFSYLSEFNRNVSLLSHHMKEAKETIQNQSFKGILQDSNMQGKNDATQRAKISLLPVFFNNFAFCSLN